MNNNATIAHEVKGDDSSSPYAFAVAVPVPDDTYQDNTTEPEIMVAPALQGYYDSSAEAQMLAVEQGLRIRQDIGRVNAQEERTHIQKADYYSKINSTIESTRIANGRDVAKQRDAEGLEVRGDKYFDGAAFERKEGERLVKEQEALFNKLNKKKGYDTQDYEVAEYGGDEYETQEYTSIYD